MNWKNNFATYGKGPIFLLNEGFLQMSKKKNNLKEKLAKKVNKLLKDRKFKQSINMF